jgi:hypothetical protein
VTRKRTFAAVLTTAGLAAGLYGAPSAAADPNPFKDLCKGGGFRIVFDESGAPFRNQGQCVNFVNHGGELFDAAGDPAVPPGGGGGIEV